MTSRSPSSSSSTTAESKKEEEKKKRRKRKKTGGIKKRRAARQLIERVTQEEYDERYYYLPEKDKYYPSVTHVLAVGLPKEKHLIEWIAQNGLAESERIKKRAGSQGTKVHELVEEMINGVPVEAKDLTLKEKRCLLGFQNFWKDHSPEPIGIEEVFVSDDLDCGGTIDYEGTVESWEGVPGVIDWKTSKNAQLSHKVQVSVYAAARGYTKAGIVTLGNTTKKRYTFTEVEIEKYLPYYFAAKEYFDLKFPYKKPTTENFPEIFSIG